MQLDLFSSSSSQDQKRDTSNLLTLLIRINSQILDGVDHRIILDCIFQSLENVISFDRIGIATFSSDKEYISMHWVKSKNPVEHLKKKFQLFMRAAV